MAPVVPPAAGVDANAVAKFFGRSDKNSGSTTRIDYSTRDYLATFLATRTSCCSLRLLHSATNSSHWVPIRESTHLSCPQIDTNTHECMIGRRKKVTMR